MEPIEIDIESDRLYCDVALLVDCPEFMEDLQKLRNKWGIKELIPLDKFTDWMDELHKRPTLERQIDLVEDKEESEEEIARQKPYTDFECDIRDLRIKYKRTDNFDKAIMYALLCGKIPDKVYKTTYWRFMNSSVLQRQKGDAESVAIFITPQTTQGDLDEQFKEAKDKMFESEDDGYLKYLHFDREFRDVRSGIREHRKWYLLRQDKLKYKQINGEAGEETARRAVNRYKKAIESFY